LLIAGRLEEKGRFGALFLVRPARAALLKMMVKGLDHVVQGLATYEAQQRQTKQWALHRPAAECGATIVLYAESA